ARVESERGRGCCRAGGRKSSFMRIAILVTLLSAASAQAGLSRLEALGMIESGDNDKAVGRAGEISRYQIQPWIWRRYDTSEEYENRHVARRVAQLHLTELERVFRRCAGRELSDFDLYVLWNAGPTYYASVGWRPARVNPIVRERANRYVNLRHREDPRPSVKLQTAALPEPVAPPAAATTFANPFSLDVGSVPSNAPLSKASPGSVLLATPAGSERLAAAGPSVFTLEPTR